MLPWECLSDKMKSRFNKGEYEKRRRDDYNAATEASEKIVRTIEDFKATLLHHMYCLKINDKKYQFHKSYKSEPPALYMVDDWFNGKLELISEFKTLNDLFDFELDGKSVKDWITEEGVGMYYKDWIM